MTKTEVSKLRVGVDPSFPPFEYIDSTGALAGFDIDLLKRAAQLNAWELVFEQVPFNQLLDQVTSGQLDLAISAITITPERQALVDFSDPYYLSGQALVVRSIDTAVADLDVLAGMRVGVQRNSTAEQLAESVHGTQIFAYDAVDSAFGRLSLGELDAVINDYPSSRLFLLRFEGLRLARDYLNVEYYGVAVGKGKTAVLERLNEALATLAGGAEYEQLHRQWFGYPPIGDEISEEDSLR